MSEYMIIDYHIKKLCIAYASSNWKFTGAILPYTITKAVKQNYLITINQPQSGNIARYHNEATFDIYFTLGTTEMLCATTQDATKDCYDPRPGTMANQMLLSPLQTRPHRSHPISYRQRGRCRLKEGQ
jgi:hypothetical protein